MVSNVLEVARVSETANKSLPNAPMGMAIIPIIISAISTHASSCR